MPVCPKLGEFYSIDIDSAVNLFEPPHDKTNKMCVCPVKFSSDWADAQADLSLRWAHNHFGGFVMRRLIFSLILANWID